MAKFQLVVGWLTQGWEKWEGKIRHDLPLISWLCASAFKTSTHGRTYIEEEKGTIALEEEEDDDDERQAINFGRTSNRIFKDIFINRTIQTWAAGSRELATKTIWFLAGITFNSNRIRL